MKNLLRASVVAALVALLTLPVAAQPEGTTLEQTIVGTPEKRELTVGPGERRVTRTLGWKDPGGRGRALAGFKQISDVHVLDEESPARVEYFDACGSEFTSAYRVQEAISLQIGNSMLRQLNAITTGPATEVPLDFVISTGDNVDNNQRNETEWFVRLLDGGEVDPNSGGATYDGYTREQFSGALPTETLEQANEPFTSVGAGPWYGVIGNHDGLIQGNAPNNIVLDTFPGRDEKAFVAIESYEDCPSSPGDLLGVLGSVNRAFENHSREVPADPKREFLARTELIDIYLQSSGRPEGHGFPLGPRDTLDRPLGYYSFEIAPRVQGISLDTVAYGGGPSGHIPDEQFQWLTKELKRNSRSYYRGNERVRNRKGRNKLIVLFSHHSSVTLNNPSGDPESHCFERSDSPDCEPNQSLHQLLEQFPNVIAWVNGHEHNNAVRRYAFNGKNSARGFWEINTAAHIDWPQQSRLIELAWKPGRRQRPDTVFVYGTSVDHAAAPIGYETDPPAWDGSVPLDEYLARVARVEAYYDACVREQQASCDANGKPTDRNVKLVSKAPFNLGR